MPLYAFRSLIIPLSSLLLYVKLNIRRYAFLVIGLYIHHRDTKHVWAPEASVLLIPGSDPVRVHRTEGLGIHLNKNDRSRP